MEFAVKLCLSRDEQYTFESTTVFETKPNLVEIVGTKLSLISEEGSSPSRILHVLIGVLWPAEVHDLDLCIKTQLPQ